MNTGTITSVGIDVSKHKSTVAARRPGGEVALPIGRLRCKESPYVSKRASPHLRRVLFEIASMILVYGNTDNPVFCFMDKKRAEGKHFYVYTVVGSAKFLRIYYAKVKEHLRVQDVAS